MYTGLYCMCSYMYIYVTVTVWRDVIMLIM